jgi:hypothetical protein
MVNINGYRQNPFRRRRRDSAAIDAKVDFYAQNIQERIKRVKTTFFYWQVGVRLSLLNLSIELFWYRRTATIITLVRIFLSRASATAQMMMSVAADGTLMQAKSAYEDGTTLPGYSDVFTNIDATMCWSGRSGDAPTDPSECRLTEQAEKVAIYAVTQFFMAAHTDSQNSFKSTMSSSWHLAFFLFVPGIIPKSCRGCRSIW